MPRLDTAVYQGWRNRQLDAGLADVIRGVGEQLGATILELLPTGLRADGDSVAARFADRLHDHFGQIVERITERCRLTADMGFDILQDRFLAEVVTDNSRHVSVD